MNNELESLFKEAQKNPFEAYGFLRNPFPTNAEEFYKVCHNQEEVKKNFLLKLKSFISDQNIKTLLISAEHRVGKTNFLRNYYYRLKDISEENRDITFRYIYINDYGDNYLIMHKALVEMIGKNFIMDLLNKLRDNKSALNEISDTDFKKGLESIISQFTLFGFDETKVSLFFEWLQGIKVPQKKINDLGVFSSITTSSLAIRYLKDLIKISRVLGVMKGLVVFMDEFELIFGASVTRAKRDKYLQDIRSLIDEIQTGIFIVCAITPGVLVDFSKNYQALKARFGEAISLSPIRNIDEALAYTQEYLDLAEKEYGNKYKNDRKKHKIIIEKDEIITIYKNLATSNKDLIFLDKSTPGAMVYQGNFFESLHDYIENKIAKSL